jgi:hypothetical protein
MVRTMDAGVTHTKVARQMLAQGGHSVMVVKRNQHQRYEALTWFFATPPLPCDPPWREGTQVNNGHGCIETWWVTCTDDRENIVMWPGVGQIVRRQAYVMFVRPHKTRCSSLVLVDFDGALTLQVGSRHARMGEVLPLLFQPSHILQRQGW